MFRLDRLLTIYFFYPFVKRYFKLKVKIPILMYHGISNSIHNNIHPYYETTTTPSVFAEHMRFLRKNGYQVIDLRQISTIFSDPCTRTGKYVVITFDDCLYDFYLNAVQILKDNRHTATVFLPVGLMGKRLAGQDVMNWNHARDLVKRHVNFGSHSMTHPKLSDLRQLDLEHEIRSSKEMIEKELGVKIELFSYPYAFPEQNISFVRGLEKLLTDSGYKVGVTTMIGSSSRRDNILFLKRIPVNNYDDLKFFKAKLEGAYDWLHLFQVAFKKIKNL